MHRPFALRLLPAVLLALLALGSTAARAQAIDYLELEPRWRFQVDPEDGGENAGWQRPDWDDSAWKLLRVPGGWEEQGITQDAPGEPAKGYDGVGWYRTRVVVPASWKDTDLQILLGLVDDLDRSYFNGTLIGEVKKGTPTPSGIIRVYTIPKALVRFGAANTIAVRVQDLGGPGGMRGGPLGILPKGGLERWRQAQGGSNDSMDLKTRFADPPAHRRILKLVHSIPTTPESLDGMLLTLAAQGFGGMATNVSFNGYLARPENWAPFEAGVRRARELGMTLWLYDEQGYPSGTSGGRVLEGHPEWEARGLYVVDAPASGASVELELPEGRLESLAALPVVAGKPQQKGAIALQDRVGADRKLRWTPPAGQWRILGFVEAPLFEGTHAARNLFKKQPYINLLMREPTARFLEINHAPYAARFPKLSNYFEATFTDEPSLMNVFMESQGRAAIPWAPDLPKRFREQHGYDLLPHLPALVADTGPDAGKVRCAFWSTVGKLVSEHFFGQIQEWCRANGVHSSGHLLAEEQLTGHIAYYGNFFDCLRRMDYPGIDCLTSDPNTVQWHIAKFIGSVADQIGAPKRMSETSDHSQRYRRPGDTRPPIVVSAAQIRGTNNLLYLNGINTTTSYYSWNGLSVAEVRDINAYIGRLGVLLTGGEHVSDVALFYPVESAWAHFTPAVRGATQQAACLRVEQSLRMAGDQLFQAARDFDYVDSHALRNAGVQEDALVVSRERHRALVLPRVETIPLDVWRKVADFWRAGGIVIALGATPANSLTEFPSREVQALTAEIFGTERPAASGQPMTIHGNARGGAGVYLGTLAEARLASVLASLLEPDFLAPAGSSLRCAHRRLEGQDFYLVINHSPESVTQEVSFRAEGPAQLWDPHTGQVSACPGTMADGRYQTRLSLMPYGAAFVSFPKSRPGKRQQAQAADTVRPQLITFREAIGVPLQLQANHPPHMPSEVTPAPERDSAGRPAIRITSRAVEGERDCWCFPKMAFEKPLDLSAYKGLHLRTRVPGDQTNCGAQLMVFIELQDGSLFLGTTGRFLSAPDGWESNPLWFASFRRHGTSGSTSTLDLKQIKEIRVGWGGYFPRTGETVTYTLGEVELIR